MVPTTEGFPADLFARWAVAITTLHGKSPYRERKDNGREWQGWTEVTQSFLHS